MKKNTFFIITASVVISIISFMALQSGLFASLYKIVLKDGTQTYSEQNVHGVVFYNSPIAEKFLVSEEASQTEWKLEYPSKESNQVSSVLFSESDIAMMIKGEKIEKNILGQNYAFFINTFPSLGLSTPPTFLFSQFGESFYIITSNTKEQSVNTFIEHFTLATQEKKSDNSQQEEEKEGCKVWFDGCNICSRSASTEDFVCTQMFCETPKSSECKEYFPTVSTAPTVSAIPQTCTVWFDGCNTCTKSADGYQCTEKMCETKTQAHCQDDETNNSSTASPDTPTSASSSAFPTPIISPTPTVIYNNTGSIAVDKKEICLGKHNTIGVFIPACKTGDAVRCDEYSKNGQYCYTCGATQCTTPIGISDRPIDGKCGDNQNICENGTPVPISDTKKTWLCEGINTGKDSEICRVQNPSLPALCGENAYECDNGKRILSPQISDGNTIIWECHAITNSITTSKDMCEYTIGKTTAECDENAIYSCLSGTATKKADKGLSHFWTCSGTDGSIKECSAIKKGIQNADAQCGTLQNECIVGSEYDAAVADTSLEYRWLCYGIGEGKNTICKKTK